MRQTAGALLHARSLVPVAVVTAVAVVLGAVALGLQVPLSRVLGGLPGLGGLDYRSLRAGDVAPLRDAFVDAALGTSFGDDRRGGPGAAQVAVPAEPAPVRRPSGPLPAPPAEAARPVADHTFTNDDFERAVVARTLPFAASTRAAGAGRQPGEPTSCSRTGGTVWYRFTPAVDGPLEADTLGTGGPAALGVFTGDDVQALQQVTCGSDPTGGASVQFEARAGTTYSFQLTGVLGTDVLGFHLAGVGVTSQVSPGRYTDLAAHREAAVSGDGNVVAYSSARPEGGSYVVVVDRRTGTREVVSLTTTGRLAEGESYLPSLSHDGRLVAFGSTADDLVAGDTNRASDVFVHDRRTRRTVRASVATGRKDGDQTFEARRHLTHGALSASGRHVVFSSGDRLSEDDLNVRPDVYVHDLVTGVTTLESVPDGGGRATRGSDYPAISADGRWVSFTTLAPELDGRREACDQGDLETRSCASVVLRDRRSGASQVVSRLLDGAPDVEVVRSSLSADGGTVVWTSTSDQVVRGDDNGLADVFAWDRTTGRTTRVSVSSTGQQQLDPTPVVTQADRSRLAAGIRTASVSSDGRFVVFESRAGNLSAGDENGSSDVFRHDRATGTTRRLSLGPAGQEGNGDSTRPAVSADGSVVVFESDARSFRDGGRSPEPGSEPVLTDVYAHAPRTTGRGGRQP